MSLSPGEIPAVPEGRFSDLYRRITAGRRVVAESRGGPSEAPHSRIREKIVRCLWFDQFLDLTELHTKDGRKLAVFSTGYWNEGAGPDFRNAEIAFDQGARLRGDVEVHVVASDWYRHDHDKDSAYHRVILHVVLQDDLDSPSVAHGDRHIPQLVLGSQLSADLDEILLSLDPDGYPRVGVGREGFCCRSIRAYGRDAAWVGRFLDIAGDERMLVKSERFAALIRTSTPDAVMYAAVMDCMGYSRHRTPFRQLTEAVPFEHLRRLLPLDAEQARQRRTVQALLFGAAGFLDTEPSDPESKQYPAALKAHWDSVRKDLPGPFMRCADWPSGRTRPANHPARRIAGISQFLGRHLHSGLCRATLTAVEHVPETGSEAARCKRALDKFRELFEDEPDGYWARRITFGPERLARPTRLIGATRAGELIVNVVIPLLLALSRPGGETQTERRLHNIYCSLRPLAENALTRYMKTRIFGAPEKAGRIVSSVRRQQGLLQVFHDFCESHTATCDQCGFLAAVEARAG